MSSINKSRLKAVILDVDGTLYRQGSVRRAVLCQLLREHMTQPGRGLLTLRVLHAYRKAQETLRTTKLNYTDLAEQQLGLACEWTGVDRGIANLYITRWMEREPLRFMARSLYAGVPEFLHAAKERGLRLGVFSDYPATAKLTVMGVAQYFDVVASAQDPEIQTFKPNPQGLATILQRLRVEKHQALYVGDRPDIDAAAASSAGLGCVIIGRHNVTDGCGWVGMRDYKDLKDAICTA